jgi:glycosyltransferase involved in cell wall biosynthesis
MNDMPKTRKIHVVIIGPSQRYLSGISYVTLRLSNAMAEYVSVKAVLFREMLPKRLFPGWKRVGEDLSGCRYREDVLVSEIIDWYNPLSWMKAAAIAGRGDVIIIQWWTSSVAHMYLIIELLNWRRKPVIIEFHESVDPLEQSVWALKIYSLFMGAIIRRLADSYVVHSEVDKKVISDHYSINRDKIRVIPIGLFDHYETVDQKDTKQWLGIDEDQVILFFGLLRPYKGVKYLIQAFEKLPAEISGKTRLLIVGETWEDNESKLLVMNSPLKSNITVIDRYVSDKEVPAFFSAADVLVIPYTRASQSGVAHIGMAFGLPVVASKVGGLSESLGNYPGTLFVTPCDTDELQMAIRTSLSRAGNYAIPEELRWNVIAGKWHDLIKTLLINYPK